MTGDQSGAATVCVDATMPKKAARKEKEIPWMIGNRDPNVACRNVAIPLHNMTDEIRRAVLPSCISSSRPVT